MVNTGTLMPMGKGQGAKKRSDFGQRMFDARMRAGLTQEQVKAALGISQGTLSQAESTGKGSSLVVQFARLYKCSPEWLALGEGQPEAPMTSLSAQALQIARQFDEITDPEWRKRAFSICDLATISPVPRAEQTELSDEAEAPAPRPTSAPAKHR